MIKNGPYPLFKWGMDNRKGHNYQNRDFEKIEKKICISNNLLLFLKL